MANNLSGRYDFGALCAFAWPTIVMLVFMALYTMVDGAFVSRLIGTDALSAVNIVYPLVNIYLAIGIMIGTGGSAIVARRIGQGDPRRAKADFTFLMIVSAVLGLAVTCIGLLELDWIIRLLGASPEIYNLCHNYAFILLFFVPMAVVQMAFLNFFVVDGRPGFGLAVVVAGGVLNMLLDYVLIETAGMGIGGAALATGIGYTVPCLLGVWHFFRKGKPGLRFARPTFDRNVLWKSVINGSSEMVTNLSLAIITYLFNIIMMHHLGVDGVAAITIVLYAEYLLCAVYFGYSTGVSPLISYQYGKGDTFRLQRMFKNSLAIVAGCSIGAFVMSYVLAGGIVSIFTPVETPVYGYALRGFKIFAISFIFMGFNIFASALFTALSNGKVSAFLSLMRSFVFIALGVALLPLFLGTDGVWLAVPVAELLSFCLSAWFVFHYRESYKFA